MSRLRLRQRLARRLGLAPAPPAAPPRGAPRPQAPPAPAAEDDEDDEVDEVEVEVTGAQLKGWLEAGREPWFLDIREPHELASGHLEGAHLIPMNQVPDHLDAIPRDATVIVYCAAGVRSYGVAHWLRGQGVAEAWSLVGGMGAWIDAGGAWLAPPHGGPLRLLRPVRITPEAATRLGLAGDPTGGLSSSAPVRDRDHSLREGPLCAEALTGAGLVTGLGPEDLSPSGDR